MLKQINIKNFILYDNVTINPNDNLTMIIGDSASGKSLLFKALNLFSHNLRFKEEFLKNKKKPCEIELVLDISKNSNFIKIIDSFNINIKDKKNFKIKHSYTSSKKEFIIEDKLKIKKIDSIKINSLIFNILNQNTTKQVSNPDYITQTIDLMSDKIIKEKLKFTEEFLIFNRKREKYQDLLKKEKYQEDEIEFINNKLNKFKILDKFSIEELNKSSQKYKTIKGILQNKELYHQSLSLISDEEIGFLDSIYDLKKILKNLNRDKEVDLVDLCIENIEKISYNLDKDLTDDSLEDHEILELKHISESYETLLRKFNNPEDIKNEYQKLIKELEILENLPLEIEACKKELDLYKKRMNIICKKINTYRKPLLNKIKKDIEKDLKSMGMVNSKISFSEIVPENDFNKHGNLFYKIKIKTTKESSFFDIDDIASGGEISRLMLSFFKNTNSNNIFLFDEVDTGLSGEISFKLGQVIKNLSLNNQVICITHLVQVGCFADSLYFVEKSEENNTRSIFKNVPQSEFKKYLSKLLIENDSSLKLVADLLDKTKKTFN